MEPQNEEGAVRTETPACLPTRLPAREIRVSPIYFICYQSNTP